MEVGLARKQVVAASDQSALGVLDSGPARVGSASPAPGLAGTPPVLRPSNHVLIEGRKII